MAPFLRLLTYRGIVAAPLCHACCLTRGTPRKFGSAEKTLQNVNMCQSRFTHYSAMTHMQLKGPSITVSHGLLLTFL